jgi:hypothetical protein
MRATPPEIRRLRSRPVHFALKDWGILAALLGSLVTALGWYVGTRIQPVAQDLGHHVEVDDKRDAEQSDEIREIVKGLHKLDVKTERLAPQHRVDSLPPALRAPAEPPRSD